MDKLRSSILHILLICICLTSEYSSVDRMHRLGRCGRRFEPCYSDQFTSPFSSMVEHFFYTEDVICSIQIMGTNLEIYNV